MTGWLWCEVCKAFRVAHGDNVWCWRCGWDMRARVVPKWSSLALYRVGKWYGDDEQ
jgi:hypothetical protein